MGAKKRLLSGIQPSGQLHIGNYFGAMRQFVDYQTEYDSYIFVANYHALTTLQNAEQLRKYTCDVVLDHVAIGLDPKKVALFVQSDVPELTELTWIFNTLITVPYLSRAHAYKDKVAQGIEATVGLFDYPALMAADILLPKADVVPVGADQKQHVEIARDIAEKFNATFGETFTVPEPLISEEVATVPGTDGRKMSKSYGNTIPLFGSKDAISKAVMSIVTDSEGGRPEHVYAIHALFQSPDELETLYAAHAGNYKALKEALIEDIEIVIAPMRERRKALTEEDAKQVLQEGKEKARRIAEETMEEVRMRTGLAL